MGLRCFGTPFLPISIILILPPENNLKKRGLVAPNIRLLWAY